MTKILLLLPFILIAMSCTVTKRVHRPGFHVVWNKEPRESTKKAPMDQANFEHDGNDLEKVEQLNSIFVAPNESENNENNELETQKTEVGLDDSDDQSSSSSTKRGILQSDSDKSIQQKLSPTTEKIAAKKGARPIFWRVHPDNLMLIGTILMVAGGLIFLGAIFAFLGAFSGNGDGGWFNFFLDLIDISNWFWLLIFLIILVLVFYLLHLIVNYVLGGPMIALFIGLGLAAFGLFLYLLGQNRSE